MRTMKRTILLFSALLLVSACVKEPSDTVGTNTEEWTEKVEVAMPTGGDIIDDAHGKEVWFAIGPMSGVGDTPANGVAQAHYFEDGSYLQNLKVNINLSEDGYFYEGWVVSEDGKDWISLGHLQAHFGDARHGVQFRGQQDLRKHLYVRVTQEADDGDPSPGEVVAEGRLKVTPR